MNKIEKIKNISLFKLIYILIGINTIYATIHYFVKSGIRGLTDSSTIGFFTSAYCNVIFLGSIALIYALVIVLLFVKYLKNNKDIKLVKGLLIVMVIFVLLLFLIILGEQFYENSKICYYICNILLFFTAQSGNAILGFIILGIYALIPIISLIVCLCIVNKKYLKKIILSALIAFIPILLFTLIVFIVSNVILGILLGVVVAFVGKSLFSMVGENIITDIDKSKAEKEIIKSIKK